MAPGPCYIIAEAGVNHNGSEERALAMVDAAAAAGADAVKFQTFRAERLVTPGAAKADYQQRQTGAGNQLAMLRALELPDETFRRIADHCRRRSIDFLSTPFDEDAVDLLVDLGCRRLKVPSGELTNAPLLARVAAAGLPILLSTGMATLDEVADAVRVIADTRSRRGHRGPLAENLTLLHCTSSYPAAIEDLNLLAMRTMAERFSLPVGYSDHSADLFAAPIARALGAAVYEKHFTLDRGLAGPDHAASLEPGELGSLVRAIRTTEVALGDGDKKPVAAELDVRIAARRSVSIARDKLAGQRLTREDLVLLRPGDGIPPLQLESVVGRRLRRDMRAGDTLRPADIEP